MGLRTPVFAANWKMNKTLKEASLFFETFLNLLPTKLDAEIIVCPSFTLFHSISSCSSQKIKLGAQNIFWEKEGAYTGEISPVMLKDSGCQYVIIGHSERRKYFAETNAIVNKKILAAFEYGLKPILCIGETLEEMEKGITRQILAEQIKEGLFRTAQSDFEKLIMAYEPVWAIGTGKADSPQQSNETIRFIRETLSELCGIHTASKIRILYGGSVKPNNIKGFMEQSEIDGALVGGASLNPEDFAKLVLSGDPAKF
jgi:triosephosphate isomerase